MITENKKGYFGEFGGSYVPEVVQKALDELETAYNKYKDDDEFLKEYHHYLKDYSGRETPLYFAESLTNYLATLPFALPIHSAETPTNKTLH